MTARTLTHVVSRLPFSIADIATEDVYGLRLTLSQYLYVCEVLEPEDGYSLSEAFDDAMYPDLDATTYALEHEILPALEGIELDEAEDLIAALTNHLRQSA